VALTVNADLAGQLYSHIVNRFENYNGEMATTRRYLDGDHVLPFMPNQRAQAAYQAMAERSIDNWLPLVSDTFVKRLFVEGYRPSNTLDNAKPWEYWQANRLDARQTIVHRGAIEYGEAYVLVLPGTKKGEKTPIIKPLLPTNSIAFYRDEDDEWPYIAARRLTDKLDGTRVLEVYDEKSVYTFEQAAEYTVPGENDGAGRPTKEQPDWAPVSKSDHNLGVVPFVRFRESLDERHVGLIYPLIPDQERINEIVFAIHMALQYSVFRQRYVTGVALPEDDAGNPINPFQAGANTLWVSEDSETKFGEFAQTMIDGHLQAYQKAVQTLAAHAQIDPNLLTGDVINVSSEALGSLQDSTTQRLNIYKMIFGEAWEQVFRLAATAAGDTKAAEDESAQARWRDDSSHEFLTTVQGLAMLVEKLGVPEQPLWPKVPGFSDQDIQAWTEAAAKADKPDPMAELLAKLQTQATTPPALPGQPADGQQPPPVPGQQPQAAQPKPPAVNSGNPAV
jgi:hypothetical protein